MKINSIIDLVKDLDTSRQTKNLNKLLIRILLHLQVEFSDDYSIDLEFYQSIGEIEIVISQNGDVVYSSTENIDSPILRKVQLQKGLVGDFLLEIKGLDGAYAFGRFTIH